MGWLPLAKKLAPYIAIVLAFAFAWQCGSSKTANKMRGDVAQAEADAKLARAERDILREALEEFRRDVVESNERVIAKAQKFDDWASQLETVVDEQSNRLASSYARRVEEARAETSELRERVAEMKPGQACCAALEEVTDVLSR